MAKDPIVDALNPMPKRDDREDRIRRRAYELWDAAGQPGGRAHEHWFTAESEEASRDNPEQSMGMPMFPRTLLRVWEATRPPFRPLRATRR